tara:strand:+ start:306 stop:785 length:480 start_codon:yes stop_codon:yes gene_type:complete
MATNSGSDCEVSCDTEIERYIRDALSDMKNEIDDLYQTVYKGNGTPSLVTRMVSAETKLQDLRDVIDEKISNLSEQNTLKFESLHEKLENKFGRLEGWIESRLGNMEKDMKNITSMLTDVSERVMEAKQIDRAGGWQMKAAAISAVAAFITAAIAILWD